VSIAGEHLVFSRDPGTARHGLCLSKSGVWWRKVDSHEEAIALQKRLGRGAWIKPIAEMRRKLRMRYQPPSRDAVVLREAERQTALSDFAAGRDWPPWEAGPIGDHVTSVPVLDRIVESVEEFAIAAHSS
jgi:hypothetical protein